MRPLINYVTLLVLASMAVACKEDKCLNCKDGGPPSDGTIGFMDSMPTCPSPCPAGEVCLQGVCVAEGQPCQTDEDCNNDQHCKEGYCRPYEVGEYDPDCMNEGFEPAELEAPAIKCSWTQGSTLSTPVVIDLGGDGRPEILFVVGTKLVAIRVPSSQGGPCTEVFNKEAGLASSSHLAVADLNGDKVPEIIALNPKNQVVVLDNQGEPIAVSQAPASGVNKNLFTGAAVANLDGQGVPEIVYAGMALRLEQQQLAVLFDKAVPRGGAYDIVLSAVADLDLDGKPEVITGNRILDGQTGADKTPGPIKAWGSGYVAVAQFDPQTPEPEIVLISSESTGGTIRIFNPDDGSLFFGPYPFGSKWGGPPTVADFDGDKQPEVAAAGYDGYYVFDPECAADPLPSFCAKKGVRWFKVTQDFTSASTGSSVFDFNGDGRAEVIYRDECWLRVYDGLDGKVLFAHSMTSGTGTDLPVIADADNDGHADIIVTGTHVDFECTDEQELKLPHQGDTPGVYVIQDPKNRWMPSRDIWNQHTYHITNIEDDGTVPQKEPNNWQSHNNYRQNVQGQPGAVPGVDLTAKWYYDIDPNTDCQNLWVLQVEVCNRGAANAPRQVSGAFYQGNPQEGGQPICTVSTEATLAPGDCTIVRCDWETPQTELLDLTFVVDDDQAQAECKEKNNLMIEHLKCPGLVE